MLGLGEVYTFSFSASFDPGLISVISSSSSSLSRVDRSAPLLPHDLLPPKQTNNRINIKTYNLQKFRFRLHYRFPIDIKSGPVSPVKVLRI